MCNPDFKIALEGGWDFSDVGMMHVWHISDYVRMKRLGLPTPGIVIENYDGYDDLVTEKELFEFMEENDIHPEWMTEKKGENQNGNF